MMTGGGLTERHKVTLQEISGVSISGLNSEGYAKGDTVTFTLTVSDSTKEIDTVKAGDETLTATNGSYSFTMGESDVTIIVTLKDKGSVETSFKVNYATSEDYSISGLKSEYKEGDTVEFVVDVVNLDKEIDSVTVSDVTDLVATTDGHYSFVMPAKDVTITVTLKDLSSDIGGAGTAQDPYIIDNKAKLLSLSEKIASEEMAADGVYSLTSDIDLTGETWSPIGDYEMPFMGTFLGNGHEIKGLSITDFGEGYLLTNQTIKFGGLFGMTYDALIQDLSLVDYSVDALVYGRDSVVYFGGLVGLAQNTIISEVDVAYSEFTLNSLQNGSSGVYIGGLVGSFYALSETEGVGLFIELQYNHVSGDIHLDTSDGEGVISYVGGIVGETYGYYGSGIVSISNTYYEGDILGGTYIGGIAGNIDYYTSILDAYALGDSLVSEDVDGSYVGGIVGGASPETFIMNAYASYTTLTAPESESYYESYAGEIYGFGYEDGFSEGSDMYGTGAFNVFFKADATVSAQNVVKVGDAATVNETFFSETLNFNGDLWDFSSTYPVLKDEKVDSQIEITLDTQGASSENVVIDATAGGYDAETIGAINSQELSKENHSFNGFTYDEEGEEFYRWYVPFDNDTTLHAKFTDLTPLLGDYTYECLYYERVTGTGWFKFDEDYFYWINSDYQTMKYEYSLLDNYILIGECLPSASGEAYGAYESSIFTLNEDGTITGVDLIDSDAIYTATPTDTPVTIADYTGNPLLGTWYSGGAEFTLLHDGTVIGKRDSKDYEHNGGFRIVGNTVEVNLFGVLSNTFTYDEESGVMVGKDGAIASRSEITSAFMTPDYTLCVYVIGEDTIVVKDNAITDLTVEGTLAEGETVVIDGISYIVEGEMLTPETPDEPDPEPVSSYYGTWTGKVGPNTATLVLNDDDTGSYNDSLFTYVDDGEKIVATEESGKFTLTIIYDEVSQSLKVTYDDGDYQFDGTLTDFVPAEDEATPEESTFIGTWTGVLEGAQTIDVTIVINDDMTGSYNGMSFTYTVEGNKISATTDDGTYEITITYIPETQEIEVHVLDTYEYYEFDGTLSDYTPAEGDSSETTPESFYGTWTGVLEGAQTIDVTIVINDDMTGSYNGMSFTYTVEGNKISATTDDGTYEITITYIPETQEIEVHVLDTYEYYEFDGTLSDYTPFN